MNPVVIFAIPDHRRMPYDPEGSEALLGEFVALPIPMPTTAMIWTDPDSGKPEVMWVDAGRIRPKDFATVWRAIEQFNAALEKHGFPAAVMQSSRWSS